MNKGVSKIRILSILITVLSTSLVISCTTSAKSANLTDEEEVIWSQNNITFYEPCDTTEEDDSDSQEICGSNKNYAGVSVLSKENLAAVKDHQSVYKKSADKYGFPWELLAVLHYREFGLKKSNPDNLQGIYQLYSYTNGGENSRAFKPAGKISNEEFQRQTDIVAELIHNNYGKGLDLKNDNDIKKMFFRFNGSAEVYKERARKMGFSEEEAERGEGSPYVMNRYDAKRDPKSPSVDSNWLGKYTSDGKYDASAADQQWGAFTVYKALTCEGGEENLNVESEEESEEDEFSDEDSSSESDAAPSCNSCERGSMNVNGSAVCLAWPLGTKKSQYTYFKGGSGTEQFQAAWKELKMGSNNKTFHYNGHSAKSWKIGAYCSGFAAAAVRWSGVDPHFTSSQPGQLAYVKKHTDIWEYFKWSGKKEDLQGGDVLDRESGHTWMVVEDEDGELYVAEASLHGFTFGHITEFYKPYKNNVWVFRAKNANNSNVGVSVKDGVNSSSTTGSIAKSGKGNGDIGASAIELAWPDTSGKYQKKPTSKFLNYFKTFKQYEKDKGQCYAKGKSCDRFAATAIRYSGVDKDIPFGMVPDMLNYVENSEDWERIDMANPKSLEEYQSGDLVFFYVGDSLEHVGIYAEDSSGKGHVVQASSCDYYGVVKDTSNITSSSYYTGTRVVYRNKNNKNNTQNKSECNSCPGKKSDDDGGSGGGKLKEGGFSSASEAEKAVMDKYRKYHGNATTEFGTDMCEKGELASYDNGRGIYKCEVPSQDNCSTFTAWFIKNYLGWAPGKISNKMGYALAEGLYNTYHSKYPKITQSNNPTPYSIVSWNSKMPAPGGSTNHTGVVLGVNGDKVFIGEAAWSNHSHLKVHTYKMSQVKGKGIYVDVSAYVKL